LPTRRSHLAGSVAWPGRWLMKLAAMGWLLPGFGAHPGLMGPCVPFGGLKPEPPWWRSLYVVDPLTR
jgi:hypothetical protein